MDSKSPFSPQSGQPGDSPKFARPIPRVANSNAGMPLAPQSPGMQVGDIYYILFRHKWTILVCSLVGFSLAAAFYKLNPPPYESRAKLFVRYVVAENKPLDPTGEVANMKSPDMRGETIMSAEREILTSFDVAKQVAEAIGPDKILPELSGDANGDLIRAAAVISGGLEVEAPRMSSVINVSFRHHDAALVQPVLAQVINRYLKTHVDIHRAVGIIGNFLTQETDQLRTRLARTEDELRKARNRAGIVSLDTSKREFAEEMIRIRDELMRTQAELAERTSILEQLAKQFPENKPVEAETPLPQAKIDEYQTVLARYSLLQKREQELLTLFTPENSRVKEVRGQLAEAETAKRKLEEENPALIRTAVTTNSTNAVPQSPGAFDYASETMRIGALQAKLKVLNAQMEQVRAQAATVDQMEGTILELLRKKELEEANYRYYAARLEQSRINEALGTGKVSNISEIQTPTPPAQDRKKILQIMAGLAVGGIALGLAWAFAYELFLDHSVRRPIDVERMLGLPLFLSIPVIGNKKKPRKAKKTAETLNTEESPATGPSSTALVQRDAEQSRLAVTSQLLYFHETLRDRLISYFESVNLTHKPKLVAVTGLDNGSGVTTTAAGLASCLSETGEGNVLLVDMTAGQGAAQQFYRGQKVCGLEEILSARASAQVEDNLFVVVEEPGRDRLSRILPQRFNKLVPQLKASNFDYIIFDMPPVSQISITPRLAGFMDMVLLVIESEKTNRDLVERATALLTQSKAHVGAVLNKTQTYVPKRLHQDSLSNF
jgi:succinoglycan biosynthesis transport protein ExoP